MKTHFFLNIVRLEGKDAPAFMPNMWRLTGRIGNDFITERHDTESQCHNRALQILNAYQYVGSK